MAAFSFQLPAPRDGVRYSEDGFWKQHGKPIKVTIPAWEGEGRLINAKVTPNGGLWVTVTIPDELAPLITTDLPGRYSLGTGQ